MKSIEIYMSQDGSQREAAMDEVEKSAKYAGLDQKDILQLRLLSEELIGMMKEIAGPYEAKFWMEAEGNRFELHLETKIKMDQDAKGELCAMATDEKTSEGKNFMGKIRKLLVRGMNQDEGASWSLDQCRKQKRDWDELEKSIVANLADDVLVTANNRRAEVVIIKSFRTVYQMRPN